MTRKSKRELEREVSALDDAAGDGDGVGLYIFERENHFESRTDAPRPDLLVPDDVRGGYQSTTPEYVTPDGYTGGMLFVSPSVIETWPGESGDDAIPVPELWDGLTDEQLREEYRRRKENDDPIPPLLEEHA